MLLGCGATDSMRSTVPPFHRSTVPPPSARRFREERRSFCHAPAGDVERVGGGEALCAHRLGTAELRPQLLGLLRHEGREVQRVSGELANDRREHRFELAATRGVLGQRPRLAVLHEFVAALHAAHHRVERILQ